MFDHSTGVIPTSQGALHWLLLRDPHHGSGSDSPPAWMNPVEVSVWEALKSDKRRRDWQLGRLAAKRLVSSLIEEKTGLDLALDQICILPHEDGWPRVVLPSLGVAAPAITLSISHSREWAFCAAMEGEGRSLGADLEFIEPRSAGFADDYFTPLEREFLSATPADQYHQLTNAIWSGKEAALKAIRRGLAEDTRLVSCLPHPVSAANPAWLPMRIVWNAAPANRPLPELAGRWRITGEFVTTLVNGV